MTKCNEGDPIRGGGNEGPETGGGCRTGTGESAHQAASGGTTTTWVHATHDPTLSNLPKYPFTVQSTSWTLQPLGRVSKQFIMQPRKLTGTVCMAPPNAALQRGKGKKGEIRQCTFLSHMGLAKVSSAILLNALARIHGEFHTALFKREKAGRNNRVSCPQPLVFLRAAKETKASEQDHWEIVARFCTRRAILSLNRRQQLSR